MLIGAVRVALRRPYTFAVMALPILIVGPLVALRTPRTSSLRSAYPDRGIRAARAGANKGRVMNSRPIGGPLTDAQLSRPDDLSTTALV